MNKDLIRSLIREGIRQNQNLTLREFLSEEPPTSEKQVDALVDNLIKRMDMSELKRRSNI